jgi:ABC-type dipeptide/oligopeptide/nickel transport system permease component
MLGYLVRRVLSALVVIVCVVFVVSSMSKLVPGDIVDMMEAGNPGMTEQDKAVLREQLGVNKPLLQTFFDYTTGIVLRGDFGNSTRFRSSAAVLIGERIPATLELALTALVLALVIAMPLGILCALKQGTAIDYFGTIVSVLGIAVPGFLVGIILILIFSVELGWLPSTGYKGSVVVAAWNALLAWDFAILWDRLRYILMPAASLAFAVIALNVRLIRSTMLEVIRQDYLQFARAKGVPERTVYLKHAFRNALIPTVTIVGLQLGNLLGGTYIIENVFAWPGIGRLAVQSIFWRDYPLIQANVLIAACLFVVLNILVDLTYRLIDPRIRYARR